MPEVTVVAGAGIGNGASISRRFAREGHAVALLARSRDVLDGIVKEIEGSGGKALGIATDLADPASVKAAFEQVRTELGAVTTLVQNGAIMIRGGFLELDPAAFETSFQVAVMGMVHCCREVLGEMESAGRGNVVLIGATGAMRGSGGFAPFAVGKFGQRALAQSLAREFGPKGIHVSHVVIDGVIAMERTRAMFPDAGPDFFLQPDDIAETVWNLVQQPRSAWSHEVDVRPFGERF